MSAYVNMVCELLRNSLPKAVVHCQVREAKRSLLDHFYAQVGKREVYHFFHFCLRFLILKAVFSPSRDMPLTVNIFMSTPGDVLWMKSIVLARYGANTFGEAGRRGGID